MEPMSEQKDPFKQSIYEYRQSTKALFAAQEAYNVHDPVSNEKYFYAKRDRLWLKRDLHVYEGSSDTDPKMMTMVDESITDSFGSFAAIDNKDNFLARFRRKFWRSWFWRETWTIEDEEKNVIGYMRAKGGFFKTLLRKFSLIGDRVDFILLFLRLHYQFFNAENELYAEYSRKFSIRDFYKLEFLDESKMNVDKRAILSICFLLDSAEER